MVAILEQVFREQWGRVVASLTGFLGDIDLAAPGDAERRLLRRRLSALEGAVQGA